MGSQFSVHLLNRNKDLLYPAIPGSQVKQRQTKSRAMDVKTKLAEDMRKLTLKLGRKKDKVAQSVNDQQTVKEAFKLSPPAPKIQKTSSSNESVEQTESVKTASTRPELLPSKVQPAKGLPHHVIAATRVSERKWTLSDLLRSLGTYVHNHCVHLHSAPTSGEVAMWVRCADRALQLNGWTINSFLLESHVVFSYMLIASAFRQGYELRSLADVKELVLMCLYVSYTYNANEISYPLRPFLVKLDRAAFWDKCTTLSLSASSNMLRLNRDSVFYKDMLSSLKRVTLL